MKQPSMTEFLFSSKGRVSRLQYNVYFMLPFVAFNWLLMELPKWFEHDLDMLFKVSLVTSILSLIILWPFMAMTNKRFHDRGASGWRQALYVLISIGGGFIFYQATTFNINPAAMTFSFTAKNEMLSMIGLGIIFIPMIMMIIELCALRGTIGTNKYGDDPLAKHLEENNG